MKELLANFTAAEIEARLARMAHMRRVADAERRVLDAVAAWVERQGEERAGELVRAWSELKGMTNGRNQTTEGE